MHSLQRMIIMQIRAAASVSHTHAAAAAAAAAPFRPTQPSLAVAVAMHSRSTWSGPAPAHLRHCHRHWHRHRPPSNAHAHCPLSASVSFIHRMPRRHFILPTGGPAIPLANNNNTKSHSTTTSSTGQDGTTTKSTSTIPDEWIDEWNREAAEWFGEAAAAPPAADSDSDSDSDSSSSISKVMAQMNDAPVSHTMENPHHQADRMDEAPNNSRAARASRRRHPEKQRVTTQMQHGEQDHAHHSANAHNAAQSASACSTHSSSSTIHSHTHHHYHYHSHYYNDSISSSHVTGDSAARRPPNNSCSESSHPTNSSFANNASVAMIPLHIPPLPPSLHPLMRARRDALHDWAQQLLSMLLKRVQQQQQQQHCGHVPNMNSSLDHATTSRMSQHHEAWSPWSSAMDGLARSQPVSHWSVTSVMDDPASDPSANQTIIIALRHAPNGDSITATATDTVTVTALLLVRLTRDSMHPIEATFFCRPPAS